MFRSYRDTIRTPKADKSLSPEIYNCDMCTKGGWHSENDVEVHKKETHSLQMHQCKVKHKDRFCNICMTLQDSKEVLIEHLKSQHLLSSPKAKRVERKIYICDECTNIFFNKDVISTHMLYAHNTNKYERNNKHFTCPKCSKLCPLKSIWFHLQRHDIPSVTMCDICLTNFPSRAALYAHVETHKGYYKCEPCGYISTQLDPFNLHLQKHAQRQVPHGRVSAEVLESVFMRHKENLVRYNIHNTLKGFNLPRCINICTLCREICLTHLELKQHVLRDHTHEKIEKERHICACGEEFDYKVVLKQHVMKMKGQHRPVAYTEVNKKNLSIERKLKKLSSRKSADKNSKIDERNNIVNEQTVAVLCDRTEVNRTISMMAHHHRIMKLLDEVQTKDLTLSIITNTEEHTVDNVKMALCDMIEIEISNQIYPMDGTDENENNDKNTDTDKMAVTVDISNTIQNTA